MQVPEYCAGIIDELIEQRRAKGWTQKDLAKATNLTQSVIARMESKKATPQLDTLVKVVLALGCSLEVVSAAGAGEA
jgi:predicted transcriptional regulator